MTLLIFFLLAITTGLLLFKFIRSSKITVMITTLFFFITGIGVISSYLLTHIEAYSMLANPSWKKHNAIVLLGAGTVKLPTENSIKPTILAYSRIYEAARLYFLCKQATTACTIIISGGDALATGKSEAAVYQEALNAIGISNANIILEPNSMNTYRNAEFTSAILKEKQFDNVLLVTSGLHMKRALLYFSYFGVQPTPVVSDYIPPKIFRLPLGYNFAITDFLLHEYEGIIRFHIYNYFGLNANPKKPGSV